VKLERDGNKVAGKELWTNSETSVVYNSPIVKDGLLFGISGRDEVFCIDTQTGKRLWSKRLEGGGGGGRGRGGYGNIVAAGPVLFALTPAGRLVVFKPEGVRG
jgi:outer membrane protein assembly factor BamB